MARASTAGPSTAASTSGSDALAAHGIDPAFYLRRRPLDEVLPWDHLDAGVSRKFLLQDLARAVEGRAHARLLDRALHVLRRLRLHDGAQRRLPSRTAPRAGEHRGGRGLALGRADRPARRRGRPGAAWETRAWHEIRGRVAARRAARTPASTTPRPVETTPLPAALTGTAEAPAGRAGEGNAEEWLGAVPSSLAPDAIALPPPCSGFVCAIARSDRLASSARRELGTVFLRAARRAALPVAFSQGHHPLPKLWLRTGASRSASRATTSTSTSS